MNYRTKTYPLFEREIKKLAKKYPSIKQDYSLLLDSLKENPKQGVDLGNNLRKIRMAITSKGKGKSGGARVIILTVLLSEEDSEIGLQYIYDKSERENITDKELTDILRRNGL